MNDEVIKSRRIKASLFKQQRLQMKSYYMYKQFEIR